MARHAEAKNLDLHEPSRFLILNNFGRELVVGEWVALNAVKNASGFIPVTRQANTNERIIGQVTDTNIASGATGSVLVQGLIPSDTSSFGLDQTVAIVNTSGTFTFAATTSGTAAIGIVSVVGATGGIVINSMTPLTSSSASSLSNLTDVTLTTLAAGELLRYNGSVWENAFVGINRLDGVTTTGQAAGNILVATSATEWETQTHLLNNLENVNVPSPTSGQVLEFDGSNWVPGVGSGATTTLEALTDVNVVNPVNGQFVAYDFHNNLMEINFGQKPIEADTFQVSGGTGVITSFITNDASEVDTAIRFQFLDSIGAASSMRAFSLRDGTTAVALVSIRNLNSGDLANFRTEFVRVLNNWQTARIPSSTIYTNPRLITWSVSGNGIHGDLGSSTSIAAPSFTFSRTGVGNSASFLTAGSEWRNASRTLETISDVDIPDPNVLVRGDLLEYAVDAGGLDVTVNAVPTAGNGNFSISSIPGVLSNYLSTSPTTGLDFIEFAFVTTTNTVSAVVNVSTAAGTNSPVLNMGIVNLATISTAGFCDQVVIALNSMMALTSNGVTYSPNTSAGIWTSSGNVLSYRYTTQLHPGNFIPEVGNFDADVINVITNRVWRRHTPVGPQVYGGIVDVPDSVPNGGVAKTLYPFKFQTGNDATFSAGFTVAEGGVTINNPGVYQADANILLEVTQNFPVPGFANGFKVRMIKTDTVGGVEVLFESLINVVAQGTPLRLNVDIPKASGIFSANTGDIVSLDIQVDGTGQLGITQVPAAIFDGQPATTNIIELLYFQQQNEMSIVRIGDNDLIDSGF